MPPASPSSSPPGPPPLPLSVAIVCRNNAATIGRTIASVAGLASEIVAVDSGSTDATIDLIQEAATPSCRVNVIRTQWLGHVRTKQMALDACTLDWALALDSDESLLPPLADSIRAAFPGGAPPADASGFSLNRKVYYRSRPLDHAWQPEWRLRLVRRADARWTGLDPHDQLRLTRGVERRLAGSLRHDSFVSFADHLQKQWHHSYTMARSLHAAGVRPSRLRMLLSPPGAFVKQLVLKRAFLDGYPGWLAAASTAAGALLKHAMLLELANSPAPPGPAGPAAPPTPPGPPADRAP